MPTPTFSEKLRLAPASSFHVLDAAKAKRMNAKTLFIPAPEEVARAISAIPEGQTRTVTQLRHELAAMGNADTACPAVTIKYWKWMAQASGEEPAFAEGAVPWWRVLKDGKPSPHLPGGVEAQIALLEAEGVSLRPPSKP